MKKILTVLLIIILVVITALIVTPLLFKKQLLQKAKDVANTSVNAKVDFSDFRLSLLRNFPNLTVSLHDVSVVNYEPFEGDTLVAFNELNAAVDILSIIKKDAIRVKSIVLDRPVLNGIILEDGTANWDIALPSEEVKPEEEDTTVSKTMDIKIALKKFEIRAASLIYDDRSNDMKASVENLNFILAGDLSQDFSSLAIESESEKINFVYGGVRYLKDAILKIVLNADADLANSVYTLKENSVALNALELRFDGKVEMPDDETISVDMTFDTPSTGFKSLLSMVPAVYMKDFQDVQTDGKLTLKGEISGMLKGETTPSAKIELIVEDGRFSYPDLPKSAENININAKVNYDGIQNDNTTLDINRFHVELGGNPVDLKMHLITPMSDPQINAQLVANIDFASLSDVIPLEDISLTGMLDASVNMIGKMSSIVNERYEEFKADGTIRLQNFEFRSPDLPQQVMIHQTVLNFSPQYVQLEAFDANIGSSDINLKGKLEDFIPYFLADGTVKGSLDLNSQLLDLNEFLTGEENDEEIVVEDTTQLTVFEVPGNIDFTLASNLKKLKYDKLDIENVNGIILIKDKKVSLTNLSMNLLQGSLVMSGEYNTQDIKTPFVDFRLDIKKVDIQSAFASFNTIRMLAPAAERARGNVSISLSLTSFLDQHMNPLLNSMAGSGRLMSSSIEINNSKTFEKIGTILKNNRFNVINLNDVDVDFEVRNGRVYIKPFDIKIGQNKLNIRGDQGIDQTMNYTMLMNIPRAELGSGVGSALDGLTSMASQQGLALDVGENVDISFLVTGTFLDPQVKPIFEKGVGAITEQVKEQVKERVEEEVERVKQEVREEVNNKSEQILKEAEDKAQLVRDEAKKAGEELVKAADTQGQKLIKEAGTNPLKKRIAEESARKLKSQAEEKAKKLEAEANKRADQILLEAKEKADQLK
jgi:hypothetical protein